MNFVAFIKDILSESNGNPSTMRMTTFLGSLIVLGTWSYSCVVTKQWIPMDTGTIGILATLVAGKVWQKGKEDEVKPQ